MGAARPFSCRPLCFIWTSPDRRERLFFGPKKAKKDLTYPRVPLRQGGLQLGPRPERGVNLRVMDCGANIGLFSLYCFAKTAGPLRTRATLLLLCCFFSARPRSYHSEHPCRDGKWPCK
jgi:hypothetical protein